MKLVHFETAASGSPDSQAWHQWRAGGIGASDAATILFNAGLLPDSTSWQRDYAGLLAEKRGEATKAKSNFAMARGKALEATVTEMVNALTGIPFKPAFGEMDDHPFIRSSFDGITFDLECIAEIKVANQSVHEIAKEGRVIAYYQPQVAHQALTAWGNPEGWRNDRVLYFANYREADEEQPLALVEVPSSADWLRKMAASLLPLHLAFWKEVQEGRAVPSEVIDLIRRYKAAKQAADEAEKAMKDLRQPILNLIEGMGVPKFAHDGFEAVKAARQGAIDYEEAFKHLGIDKQALEPFRKAGSVSWTLKAK